MKMFTLAAALLVVGFSTPAFSGDDVVKEGEALKLSDAEITQEQYDRLLEQVKAAKKAQLRNNKKQTKESIRSDKDKKLTEAEKAEYEKSKQKRIIQALKDNPDLNPLYLEDRLESVEKAPSAATRPSNPSTTVAGTAASQPAGKSNTATQPTDANKAPVTDLLGKTTAQPAN